jgi:glycosyltransferase involved in cell wall biosynthesis
MPPDVSSSRVTVLQLDDAPTWRGGQQQVLYLHQGLLVKGVDSRVVCREGGALHRRLQEERLPHYAFAHLGAHDLVSATRLGRLARAEGAMVHVHSSHAHDLALWAHRIAGPFPLLVSRRVDFPVGRGWWGRRKYRSRRVRAYLAISSAVERELREGGVAPQRIHRVSSGIDLTRFDSVETDPQWRQRLGLAPGELLLGSVAALAPHKDQDTLLRAFAEFRARGGRGKLLILGEGELRERLERTRQRLGLEDEVAMPGFVDPVLPVMKSFDIFVLSSCLEGLGTAILDAMALGLPVVATRTGGIVDAVAEERSGLLVPPRDASALASALLRLQSDAETRRRMGEDALDRVQDFDVRRTVERTIDVYDDVAAQRD